MSKNLTRKGLALGALFALGSSVIAGAPAQASSAITVGPALGTSLVTTLGTKFVVSANVGSAVTDTAAGTLKFSISNAGKNLSTFRAVDTTVALANTAALAGSIVADTTNTTIVTAAATGMTSAKTAAVAISTSATATTTADVTAFLDLNGNNAIDAGENTGNSVTITFVANSGLTVAATLTQPLIGATTLVGKATTTPVLNGNYATNVKFDYTSATTLTPADGIYTATQAADGSWSANAAIASATAGSYSVQLEVGGALVGTAVTATTPAVTVATGTAALTVTNDSLANGTVRAGAKAATAVLTYLDGASTPAAVKAGIPVVVTVATTTVAAPSTSLITVGGKAISTTAGGTITVDATTDATGKVTLPITSATGTANDKITISAVAEGVALTANLVVEWKSLTYTLSDAKDDTSASADRAMTRGGKLMFDYVVVDQFGVAISGNARVKTVTSGGTTNTQYNNLVGGKVTVTVTDTQTTTSNANTIVSTLETQDSASLNWTANVAAATPASINATVSSTAFSFDTVPNQTAGAFTGTVSSNALTATPNNGVAITGAASASLSTAIAGQPVKVSGTGLAFLVNSKVYQGSVEFFSGATNGNFAVTVYSTKSGDQTVTFTTGTATSSVVVKFDAGAVALVSLDAPAQAQVGQALDVVVTTTDKWGNAKGSAVDTAAANEGNVVLSSTGTGYFANTAPVTNATTGKATVKYIVGTADIGTAFLSATLDLATDVTGARSIEFGLTDGDVLAGGKRIFVNAEFAKGRTVTVTVNGKRLYSKVQTTDNAVELAFTQRRAGTYTVTVRISGGIVFTEKVTIN